MTTAMRPRVTISATIPTQQYGNIQPSFEAEADTHQEAMDLALLQMKEVWDRVGLKPLDVRGLSGDPQLLPLKPMGEELVCWASGTRVMFDRIGHVYSTADSSSWLSGSTFASRFKNEFNAPIVAARMAANNGVDADAIVAMWELNRDASSTVGSAVHLALQLRGQYAALSRAVKDGRLDSALTKNPILLPIVEEFFEGREHEEALYEVFVADPKRRHCGFIDRLLIEPDGLTVEDYKTNTDLTKSETIKEPFKGLVPNTKMGAYWLQLSFYARILQVHGKTVKGLRIHHWDEPRWKTHEHEVIDLDAAFDKG